MNHEQYIGQNLTQVEKELKERNKRYRIVRKDTEVYMVTMDLQPLRLNLEVDDGVVTKITMG